MIKREAGGNTRHILHRNTRYSRLAVKFPHGEVMAINRGATVLLSRSACSVATARNAIDCLYGKVL